MYISEKTPALNFSSHLQKLLLINYWVQLIIRDGEKLQFGVSF